MIWGMTHTLDHTLLMKVEILQKMHHKTDKLTDLAGQVSSVVPTVLYMGLSVAIGEGWCCGETRVLHYTRPFGLGVDRRV